MRRQINKEDIVWKGKHIFRGKVSGLKINPDELDITPEDIGAATSEQGDKADSALQPGDKIPSKDVSGLDDLLKDKVNKSGDIITGQLLFEDPNNRSKIILTKYKDGTGHKNAPTELDINSIYLHLGGTEYAANSYRLIGFGYRHSLDSSHAPVVIGFQETNIDGSDMGRFIIATRNVNTDTAPTIRFTVEPNGDIKALDGAKFVGDGSGLTNLPKDKGVAVADATDETDVVTQFNALLTSLRNAGYIET